MNSAVPEAGYVWDDTIWFLFNGTNVCGKLVGYNPTSLQLWFEGRIVSNGYLKFDRIREGRYKMRRTVFVGVIGEVVSEIEVNRERIG